MSRITSFIPIILILKRLHIKSLRNWINFIIGCCLNVVDLFMDVQCSGIKMICKSIKIRNINQHVEHNSWIVKFVGLHSEADGLIEHTSIEQFEPSLQKSIFEKWFNKLYEVKRAPSVQKTIGPSKT